MLDLYNYSLLTIFLVGLFAILVAIEVGRWLGARARVVRVMKMFPPWKAQSSACWP